MNYTMTVKPGMNVRIVTEVDLSKERIHVKNSTVYDVKGKTVIIAQTDPPILKSMLNKEVVITYVVAEKKGPVRYGFPAKVAEFIDRFKMNPSQEVRALAVSRRTDPAPYSIRMFYRVEPISKSNITMTVHRKAVNILDISLGGVRFSHDRSLALDAGVPLDVSVTVDGRIYRLEARVLRTWDGDNERVRNELGFAAVEFLYLDKTVEHELSRKIREIERANRFDDVFP
jgi:hypothetical protein